MKSPALGKKISVDLCSSAKESHGFNESHGSSNPLMKSPHGCVFVRPHVVVRGEDAQAHCRSWVSAFGVSLGTTCAVHECRDLGLGLSSLAFDQGQDVDDCRHSFFCSCCVSMAT